MPSSENYWLKASDVSALNQSGKFHLPNGGDGVSDAKGQITATKIT